MPNFLTTQSRPRSAAFALLALGALLLFTQFSLRAPVALLFQGLCVGAVTALTAAGIVLIYRTQRFVNFAQAAVGGAAGVVSFNLIRVNGVPFLLALPAGLLVAALIGLVVEFAFIKRFFKAPRLVLTVVTIALAQVLPGGVTAALQRVMPFIFPDDSATLREQLGDFDLKLPFEGFSFQIGDLPLDFGFAHLFALEMSAVALLVLAAFFRFTRAGVAVRGVAENADRATLLGISVGALSTTVWILTSVLSGVSVILTGVLITPAVAQNTGPAVLLPALAAAVVGRMQSLPVTVVAAIGIAITQQTVGFTNPTKSGLVDLALLGVIAVGLVLQRKKAGRSEAGSESSWQATEEQRPIPKELNVVPGVRFGRIALLAIGATIVVLLPFFASTGLTATASGVAITGIVGLSLVVLTGWAGQVSLGQFGFVAIGTVVGGSLVGRVGIPFWFVAPLMAVLVGAIAVVVGLPALRIRGLFLAITTFAFAIAVQSTLFNPDYFGWLLPDSIERPTLFLVDFADETSMYFLCLASLILSIVVVLNLRRSRIGRILIGMRENEANLQSFGVNLVRTKLLAFAISGALCGFAGSLLAVQQGAVSQASFSAQRSIDVFITTVLGGIGSVPGALLGAVFKAVTEDVIRSDFLAPLVGPGGLLLILFLSPGGLISLLNGMRDSALRIIAQRRRIVVPSLFSDLDPEALMARLVPLAEPIPNSGLAALPPSTRFRRSSELYGEDRVVAGAVTRKSAPELPALNRGDDPIDDLVPAGTAGASS